jgi:hypothetical protein
MTDPDEVSCVQTTSHADQEDERTTMNWSEERQTQDVDIPASWDDSQAKEKLPALQRHVTVAHWLSVLRMGFSDAGKLAGFTNEVLMIQMRGLMMDHNVPQKVSTQVT